MFKDWTEALSVYKVLAPITLCYIPNWSTHAGVRNYIKLLDLSALATITLYDVDFNPSGKVVGLGNYLINDSLCDQELKDNINIFSEKHLEDFDDNSADEKIVFKPQEGSRFIENLEAPELDLHLEFNETSKYSNFQECESYIFSSEITTIEEALRLIENDEYDIHSHRVQLDKDLPPLLEGVSKDQWCYKKNDALYLAHSRILSLVYDESYYNSWMMSSKLPDQTHLGHGPNLRPLGVTKEDSLLEDFNWSGKSFFFRQDYSIGNGLRVMNWDTFNHNFYDWNTIESLEWDIMRDITRGEAYQGVVCKFQPEDGERKSSLDSYLSVEMNGSVTIIEN